MLSRGVSAVKLTMLDQMRVWAGLTGLALAAWFFAALWVGTPVSATLPMLVVSIGGFELFLFVQDLWLKRKANHG